MNLIFIRTIFFASLLWVTVSGTAWSALLGVVPSVPNTTYTNATGTSYDAVSGLLKVSATPFTAQITTGGSLALIATPKSLTISIQVDSAGNLVGGVAGDDLVLTGSVGGYSGVLLTGEIIEFGILDAPTAIDYLDFRFRVTGGSMAALFAGKDIGITQSIENSTFTGLFSTSFKGGAKGNLGPIPPKKICNGSIGDFIWNDANRNGIQDGGELGIDNVSVSLKDSSNAVIDSKLSGPNGAYLFTGLCAGDYTVVVDTATLPPGFVASPTLQGGNPVIDSNPNSFAVNLPTGTSSDLTIDFGYNSPCSGSIGDLVWHDLNRNGIQDPGEPGLGTITVNLRDPLTNNLITSTTTDGSGIYTFSGLCAGNYRVEAIAPSGFVLSPALKGGNTANDSNLNPTDVFLATDNTGDVTIDFGFNTPCAGSIGDFVWNDLNRNGIQDSGEPGINGVLVWLKDDFSNVIATATTTGNGGYQFGGLCAGTYRVEVDTTSTALVGMAVSPSGVGSDRTVDSNGSPAAVVLATDNSSDPTIDFGYNSPCSGFIGDMVWLDANRDGIQNFGELGINGVLVTLKDSVNTTITITTTGLGPLGQAGFYKFSGLCGGNYTVEVATPAGLQPSPSTQGLDTTVDSNGSPASVNLPSDFSSDATIDFGFNAPCAGSIGNLVWDDLNRNGIQDSGEPGLDGVTVRLLTLSNVQLASTTTADGGLYSFIGLCAGDYKVEVVPPAGRSASSTLVGSDRTVDSNPNPNAINLPSDTSSDQSIDFGFNTPCSGKIGDFVWHDTNRDGIQNFGEPGINGAAVVLKNSQGVVIASTNTDSSGGYLFGGLCRGDYVVEVATPAGFVASPSMQGTSSALDSNGSPAPVSLLADDGSDLTIDFGFNTPCTGSIGDLVWNDLNQNGIQDTGEPGITGVTVNLRDSNYTLLRTTSTASDGSYHFIGLCSGDYKVEVVSPAGMTPTTIGAGSDPEKDSNPNPSIVFLSSDATIDNSIDFGFFTLAPAITVIETCTNAPSPDMSIVFTATISNTGNETLTGISCTDTLGKTVAVADILPGASGSATFSYVQLLSPLSDTVTCSAKGAVSTTPVTASSLASSCSINTIPSITVNETCTNAPAPDQPIVFTASIKNSGNETLIGVSCKDTLGTTLPVADILPNTSVSASFGYTQLLSPLSNAVTCSAKGAISNTTVTATSLATSCIVIKPSLTIKKLTNGFDAPTAPGPTLIVGKPVTWTYTVTNTGNIALTNVVVTDDKVAIVSCPDSTIAVGASMTCRATGTAVAGQYNNVGTVTATGLGTQLTASYPSYYYGSLGNNCTYTQGFWKNHPDKWPVSFLTLGTVTYSKDQLLAIFNTPVTGNGLISLAHQLIATKLNLINGAMVTSEIQNAITSADNMIGSLIVPPVGGGALATSTTSTLEGLLDSYNSGLAAGGPGHCSDQPGVPCSGIIGDYVWNDTNGNGVQDPSELGISGLLITLKNSVTGATKTATTNTSGNYSFSGVCAGSYTVTVATPTGMVQSPSAVPGSTTTADSNGTPAAIVMPTDNYVDNSIDFGFYKGSCTGSIGDLVWNDLNKNGIQDTGEAGIAGIKFTLKNSKTGASSIATSDTFGKYLFTGLCSGTYAVSVAAPNGYTASPSLKGTDRAKDSNANPTSVTLGTNSTSDKTVDFGFYKTVTTCSGSIGNLIWNDVNSNGIQDTGEQGISCVQVTLKNESTGATTTASTDSNGGYLFTGLCAGSYTVTATTPVSFTASPIAQGSDRTKDSNANPTTGIQLVANNSAELSIDIGFYKTPTPPQATGCSLGYWKNHTGNWPIAYKTTSDFDTTFGTSAYKPDINLLQALISGGGGLSKLARQGAAALLNAQDTRVTGFPLSVAEVKAAVKNAIFTGNYEPLATQLDTYNNLGCPLN